MAALEAAMDPDIALSDLTVVDLDEIAQRLDPLHVHVAHVQIVEPSLPAGRQIESSSGITPSLPSV
jgi:uncharacterized protein HemX